MWTTTRSNCEQLRRAGRHHVGQSLLTPTRIYVKQVLAVMKEVNVKGVCHITGGGFYENIPRGLQEGCSASIDKADVRTPPCSTG